ncbi:hypothetical protein C8J57DRAFT_1515954 [Mycena rebaudengoi]|nr:hypothetical protein C8J57DRAFT_1515954 [Mycena rebaudengoi]
MLTAQADGGMTLGQVAMTPYDMNCPVWQDGVFKGDQASFSPLAVNGGDDGPNFTTFQPGWVQTPVGAGGMVRTAVAVWRRNITRDVAVCYIAVLRSWSPRTHFTDVLPYLVAYDLGVARILTSEPAVFPHFPIVVSDFAVVHPAIAVVQPHITLVLSDEPVVQPGVATVFSKQVLSILLVNFTNPPFFCSTFSQLPNAALAYVAEVFTNLTHGFAVVSKILAGLPDVFSSLTFIFSRLACLQSDVTVVVSLEPRSNIERGKSESFLPGLAFMGSDAFSTSLSKSSNGLSSQMDFVV